MRATITSRPLTHDISKLKGIAKKKGQRPVSLKTMKKAIAEGFAHCKVRPYPVNPL